MRRILCVWLPSWPTLRLRRPGFARSGSEQSDKPLATVITIRGVRRLAAVCSLAAAAGLSAEQALTEARAICPELDVVEADPAADRAALAALAGWAERYTPLAAADPPDGLFLDITGCAYLFGNEDGLAADLSARLERHALPHRIAVAGTPGAAWALARCATPRGIFTVLRAGEEKAALGTLPVALLRLEARTVASLRRLGLRSIAELARQPRGEISARFGPMPTLRLDQAFGAVEEAIAWPRPPLPWAERLAFAEPIGTPEDLARTLDVLARALCARLEAAVSGARHFSVTFLRVDGARPCIAIGTAEPVRDPTYVAKLLGAKLTTVAPGFGIDAAVLQAGGIETLNPPQAALGALGREKEGALAATIDALANRLGPENLWRPAPHDSHVPERSTRRIPPLSSAPAWEHDPGIERPIRLLRRPEPIEATALVPDEPPILFRWRGALHRVRAASGPERIAAEWWRRTPDDSRPESDLIRDYYRVEDSAGARFWIFRAGLETMPRWFLHGLFG